MNFSFRKYWADDKEWSEVFLSLSTEILLSLQIFFLIHLRILRIISLFETVWLSLVQYTISQAIGNIGNIGNAGENGSFMLQLNI